jgi:hypothetical protein
MRILVSRRNALPLAAAMTLSFAAALPVVAADAPPDLAEPDMTCGTCDPGGGDPGPPASRRILDAWARAQVNGYYCGPASGQVIINHSWGISVDAINSGAKGEPKNKYTQLAIADAMRTTKAGTDRFGVRDGLRALARTPAGLTWRKFDGLTKGQELHDKIVEDIWTYSTPMAIAVNPHDKNTDYHLPSFPKECGCQHWIAVYGYDGFWADNPDKATVWYTESAGNGDMKPGPYAVDARTLWKVNRDNAGSGVWLTK